MHVCKGGQISEVGAKFPRKLGPPGAIFPRKFGRGGPNFRGGAKFPVTPEILSGALTKLPDKVSVTGEYLIQGLIRAI